MSSSKDELEIKSKSFPDKPGVYLFRDIENKVIYVGKAKSLLKRIKSYFGKKVDRKTVRIQQYTYNLEYITTNTEMEALILENELIKIHKPILNARLKDDKTYPYLKLTISEDYPRVEIVRKREENSQDLYFGPFADTKSLRLALKKALTIFPIARCKKTIIEGKKDRSCLFYQMHRCVAPCAGKISKDEYRKLTNQFIKLFEGKQHDLIVELKEDMNKTANNLEFERAALIRDKVNILEKIIEKQFVVSMDLSAEYDIIGLEKSENNSLLQLLIMRQGKVVEQKHFIIDLPIHLDDSEILAAFIKQYYSKTDFIPNKILTKIPVKDEEIINNWLKIRKKEDEVGKLILICAKTQEEESLIELAYKNAKSNLITQIRIEQIKEERIVKSLEELREVLGLHKIPERIEGYDISTLGGSNTVGSCVVFENGNPKKSDYRKFNIKSIQSQDDYTSLQEVLRRRFTGSLADSMDKPDLILIDGGIGQVNSVYKELSKFNIEIPIIGLAKEFEEIHFPDERKPLLLEERSQGLKLLQKIRDEAHRFAVSFHRQKRSKKMISSSLEKIPGIGKKRMDILQKNFDSIKAIKKASIETLEQIPGISRKLAEEIVNYYKKQF
ncbi:MAG: excinuclease ABC subunit UvrC [Asgard group archaeon]|nr:excinuclease ABC subunit UvrC [Asgard group archaeon]